MQVTRNEQAELDLLKDMYKAMYDPNRSQPSVSGMIYCLTKAYYESEMVVASPDEIPTHRNKKQLLYFVTGLGLERVILMDRQIADSGTFEGISWHVDHIGEDDFYEIKSTRGRLPKPGEDLESFLHTGWKKQILAYWKVNGISSGKIAVLHLIQPELLVYDISATQKEIEDNWAWIKQRAITYLKFVRQGQPPEPFQYNEDWECKDCNWRVLCDARAKLPSSTRTIT